MHHAAANSAALDLNDVVKAVHARDARPNSASTLARQAATIRRISKIPNPTISASPFPSPHGPATSLPAVYLGKDGVSSSMEAVGRRLCGALSPVNVVSWIGSGQRPAPPPPATGARCGALDSGEILSPEKPLFPPRAPPSTPPRAPRARVNGTSDAVERLGRRPVQRPRQRRQRRPGRGEILSAGSGRRRRRWPGWDVRLRQYGVGPLGLLQLQRKAPVAASRHHRQRLRVPATLLRCRWGRGPSPRSALRAVADALRRPLKRGDDDEEKVGALCVARCERLVYTIRCGMIDW